MFDLDQLVADCRAARSEVQPRLAVRDVVKRAVSKPSSVADGLRPAQGGLALLYHDDELTILNVVWAPHMTIYPHDHRMWAAIGLYSGGEENTFYRRDGDGLDTSGGRSLRPKDVCLLGDDVVHSVHNPTAEHAGAIHVYGGDFFTMPRSEWTGSPLREGAFDVQRVLDLFEASNAELE